MKLLLFHNTEPRIAEAKRDSEVSGLKEISQANLTGVARQTESEKPSVWSRAKHSVENFVNRHSQATLYATGIGVWIIIGAGTAMAAGASGSVVAGCGAVGALAGAYQSFVLDGPY